MTALHKYAPFVQLLICIGMYIVITFGFYGIAVGYILPHFYGISPSAIATSDYSDPHLVHVMKLFQFAYSIFSFLIPALLFFVLWHKKPFKYAGLAAKIHWGWALAGVVVLFACLPAVGLLADLNKQIHFGETFQAMQERAQALTQAMLKMPDTYSLWFNLLLIAVIPAIAEEFFFRGAIQRILIKLTHKAWIGILITAIFFSLVHGEMMGFLPRVALGAVLGLVYFYSGNLWYAVIVHFVNNGFQVVLFFLFQHDYIQMDVTKDTPTPVALGIISILVVIGLFFLYKKWVPQNPDKILWNKPKEDPTNRLTL